MFEGDDCRNSFWLLEKLVGTLGDCAVYNQILRCIWIGYIALFQKILCAFFKCYNYILHFVFVLLSCLCSHARALTRRTCVCVCMLCVSCQCQPRRESCQSHSIKGDYVVCRCASLCLPNDWLLTFSPCLLPVGGRGGTTDQLPPALLPLSLAEA